MARRISPSSRRASRANTTRRRKSSRTTCLRCCRSWRRKGSSTMRALEPPMALLAEVTHRCPLQCPYCSNPLELDRVATELDTDSWQRVLDEAAALGVLQVHFSGGEPLVRRDLATLVGHANKCGLYVNLITSGIRLDAFRLGHLIDAGLEHVQLSLQDSDAASGDRIAGFAGAQQAKREAAALVCAMGLPLTVNAVV